MALFNEVDILDTSILNFAGGPGAPAFEIIQIFCNKLGIETNLNLKAIGDINQNSEKLENHFTLRHKFLTYHVLSILLRMIYRSRFIIFSIRP